MGKAIVEKQELEGWGKATVEKLAKDLQGEFPRMKGFSSRNIWYMRSFYLYYQENKKLQTLSAEISWSHNVTILEKCKDNLEREFYLKMTRKNKWSYRLLLHHLENQTYERTLLNQTNFDKSLPLSIKDKAKLLVKDEYTFDFLNLSDEHDERQLEKALLSRVEHFLREMGGTFAFVGSQYRLEVGDQEYFVDLLLYHRHLKCLVAVELKIGPFIPEYVGKMQFYLAVLDDTVRIEGENPSIGIILCKSKNKTIVEYALKDSNRPMGVAKYCTVNELPKELQKELPTPEQIAHLLDEIDS